MKKILFTGGSGLLAINWAVAIRDQYDVCLGLHQRRISLTGVNERYISLESVDEVRCLLDDVQPDLVIHTVGLTSVEQCEKKPELARHVNVDLSECVAKACALTGVIMVHVSTDHLFSGQKPLCSECDFVEPQNEYGRTKAEAEERVLAVCPDALIIRTNFYGWGTTYRQSFSDNIIASLREGRPVRLFADVFYTPIVIESLVHAVHDLIALKESGILHVVGDERLSKYQFGVKIADQFQFDRELVHSCCLAERPGLVRRPLDMSLSNDKVCEALGYGLGRVDQQLKKLFEQESIMATKEVMRL